VTSYAARLMRPHPIGDAGPRRRGSVRRGWVRRVAPPDPVLAAVSVLLFVAGCLAVYAATRNHLLAQGRDPRFYIKRDLVNGGIGLVLAVLATRCDLRLVTGLLPVLYTGGILALLAVLTPLGVTINGAHAWFKLGPLELEPSEFFKVLLVLLTAVLLGDVRRAEVARTRPQAGSVLRCLALVAAPMLLVLAEPALGVAIVLVVVLVLQVTISGAPRVWIVGLVGGGLLAAVLAVQLHALKPYQQARFTAFLAPTSDTTGVGYHLEQSQVAIGSGGLLGRGYLDGDQTNSGFVPEQQTDFIFTVVGEESGLAGGAVLLVLYAVLLNRGFRLAARAADGFDALVAAGVTTWFAVQCFINIAMTIGLAPVTGLPLPFLSYGGSALFATAVGVGLLQNVARRTHRAVARSG